MTIRIEIPGEPRPRLGVTITEIGIDKGIVIKYSKYTISCALFWNPGGGWARSEPKSDRSICSQWCEDLGIDVFTVWTLDKWPQKLESYFRVLEWIPKKYNYQKLVIGGVSSGAHETLSIIAKSYEGLRLQGIFLVAPVTSIHNSSCWRSKPEPMIKGILGPKKLQEYIETTFPDPNSKDPTVNPDYTLPYKLGRTPVTVITFSKDILTDDAERLIKGCKEQGADTNIIRLQGEHHALRTDANARRRATEAINSLFSHDLPPEDDQVQHSNSFQTRFQSPSSPTNSEATPQSQVASLQTILLLTIFLLTFKTYEEA